MFRSNDRHIPTLSATSLQRLSDCLFVHYLPSFQRYQMEWFRCKYYSSSARSHIYQRFVLDIPGVFPYPFSLLLEKNNLVDDCVEQCASRGAQESGQAATCKIGSL